MGNINSRVVEVDVGGKKTTLDKICGNKYVLNVEQVRDSTQTVSDAVREGIEFLKSRGGGEPIIPPTDTEDEVRVNIYRNKETHNLEDVFRTRYFRSPTGSEKRPYTGDNWKEGDFVLGTVHSGTIVFGWLCTQEGSPGTWRAIGE